ncbi:MAG: hypothetical protein NTY96_00235 [Bacteroidetes bacterium]|nr:hypothetical protein [Bacteroidota bacterium]
MKRSLFIILIAAMVLGGTAIVSCKKKTKDPNYPQLVGAWKGQTNQNIPIEVDVANNGGDLYVTYVNLKYSAGPGDTASIVKYSSSGLYQMSGTSFYIFLDGTAPNVSTIAGVYHLDTLKLAGTFVGYSGNPPVATNGTYTAIKSSK